MRSRLRAAGGATWLAVLTALPVLAVTVVLTLAAVPSPTSVLVVNSDASVVKYLEVQAAFKDTLGAGSLTELDLNKAGEPGLRRALTFNNPRIIYCIGGNAYKLAVELDRDRPKVLSTAINYEHLKPNPRTTRIIANELPAGAQLTLFRHFFPKLRRVGVVYNAAINKQWFDQAVASGKEVGIEVIGRVVTRRSQVKDAIGFLAEKVDAFWLIPDPVVLDNIPTTRLYFELTDAAMKPVFTYSDVYVGLGPALVLSPDMPTIGRQAAEVVRDYAGAPLVSSPAGSEVTLNLQRVERYRLELNREALNSVNNLIR